LSNKSTGPAPGGKSNWAVIDPFVGFESPGMLMLVTPPMTLATPSVNTKLCTGQSPVSMTPLVLTSRNS